MKSIKIRTKSFKNKKGIKCLAEYRGDHIVLAPSVKGIKRRYVLRHELCHHFDPHIIGRRYLQSMTDLAVLVTRTFNPHTPKQLEKAEKNALKFVEETICHVYHPYQWGSEARANIATLFPEELVMPTTRTGLRIARFMRDYTIENDKIRLYDRSFSHYFERNVLNKRRKK